jgi:hypothetical protein
MVLLQLLPLVLDRLGLVCLVLVAYEGRRSSVLFAFLDEVFSMVGGWLAETESLVTSNRIASLQDRYCASRRLVVQEVVSALLPTKDMSFLSTCVRVYLTLI